MNNTEDKSWFDPEVATFGDRLAGAREQAGMSQEELAERLGVKVSTLRKWEEDLSEPRANRLSMMSGLLNVSFRWLLNGQGPGVDAPSNNSAATLVIDASVAELRALRRASAEIGDRMIALEAQLRDLKDQMPK